MEENKKIEFKEELTIEDLQKANYYNFKRQKKYLFNQIIFIAMALLMIGMSIAQKQWIFLGVGILILIFSTVLFVPLYKKLINNAVSRTFKESLKINLSFSESGFMYTLEDEDQSNFSEYTYQQVMKVYNLKDYIYVYFNTSSIAIIKKEACNEIEELISLIEGKYKDTNKYIIDEKTSL